MTAELTAVLRELRALSAEHQRRAGLETQAGNAIQAAREEGAARALELAADHLARGGHLKPEPTL